MSNDDLIERTILREGREIYRLEWSNHIGDGWTALGALGGRVHLLTCEDGYRGTTNDWPAAFARWPEALGCVNSTTQRVEAPDVAAEELRPQRAEERS